MFVTALYLILIKYVINMANCTKEIIGVRGITLYLNSNIQLVRPNISIENEVNIITNGEGSFIINEVNALPKWERTLGYSGNYNQNYFDEFTFLVNGVENETPAIIQDLRNNRLGYIAEINTTGNDCFIFQAPVFLNKKNTKPVNSHSWTVSLSYRKPTFLDRLTRLTATLTTELISITSSVEIVGIKSMALYINDNVRIRRPDTSKENEVDLIAHGTGSYVISDINELPKWERSIAYSGNYMQNFLDEFSFFLHGINNEIPEAIKNIRNNRLGYIVEIITTGNKSFVFPTPVFLNGNNTKQIDSHSWAVSLSYRKATFFDKLTKLNTILMTQSYILVADNQILGDGSGRAIVANK